jgi:hypothetical protein
MRGRLGQALTGDSSRAGSPSQRRRPFDESPAADAEEETDDGVGGIVLPEVDDGETDSQWVEQPEPPHPAMPHGADEGERDDHRYRDVQGWHRAVRELVCTGVHVAESTRLATTTRCNGCIRPS